MAFIFNGSSRIISCTLGTNYISVRDLWSRWVDWILDSDNSKYAIAFTTLGGEDIDVSSGIKIPIYLFLQNGWRIRPQEANHTLVVGDGILLVSGGGDPFTNTIGNFQLRINYQQPVQAISFNSSGSSSVGITAQEIWNHTTRTLTAIGTADIGKETTLQEVKRAAQLAVALSS
jgi:hypothetical protein